MLAGIWRHRVCLGAGAEVPQLRDRAEFVFDLTRRRLDRTPAVARLVPSDLVDASRDLAITLAVQGPVLLPHGDLHPGNVLRGMDGLVATDLQPCLGDPTFDTLDWVLANGGGEQAIRHRIDWLAGCVDEIDAHRTWARCRALAAVLAVSCLSRSQDPVGGEMLAIARTTTAWR